MAKSFRQKEIENEDRLFNEYSRRLDERDRPEEEEPMDISEAVCQSAYVARDKCGCVMGATIAVSLEEDIQLFNQIALMVRKWIEKGWNVQKVSGPVMVTGCKCQIAELRKSRKE